MKMPPSNTNTTENKPSRLLTNDENLQLFQLLGHKWQTIATSVVQLFTTDPPNHSQWFKRDTGILCFIKDQIRKNYFFRLFCLRRNTMIWEHEMYNNMEYIESTSFLHIFEGEECMIAFNFSSVEEARDFRATVNQKIEVRKRREEKRLKTQANKPPLPQDFNQYKKVPDLAAKSAKRRRNITKADIGAPLNFKHVSHIGWNPESGFDINSEDEQLKKFFEKAGVSEKQLQDKDTRDFIYDFINKHGGREAVVEETNHLTRKAPPLPPPSSNSNVENNAVVPPVPPRGSGPNKPHVRAAPPPPPSNNSNNNSFKQSAAPPPPPPMDFIPPAPPPMPTDFNNTEPQVVINDKSPMNSITQDLNSALMESIRAGTSLKPVEERKVTTPTVDNPRNDLLSEIRKGTTLRPVEERHIKPISNAGDQGGGDLAGALARALAEWRKAVHSEDDDDDTSDSNDDEWMD